MSFRLRAVLSACVLFVFGASAHVTDPSSDLAKYGIWGNQSLSFTGGGSVTASGGWIGSGALLTFGGGGSGTTVNGEVHTLGDMTVAGNKWDPGNGSRFNEAVYVQGDLGFGYAQFVKNAWATTTTTGGTSQYTGTLTTGAMSEVVPAFRTTNYFPDGTHDIDAGPDCLYNGSGWNCNGGSDTLPPGTYGAVRVESGFSGARFLAGEYYAKSLTILSGAELLVAKGSSEATRIILRDNFVFESPADLGPVIPGAAPDPSIYYGRILIYSEGAGTIQLKSGATLAATLYAPFGTIDVESPFTLYGQILAKNISINTQFSGNLGMFVPFDPPEITLVGGSSFSIAEAPNSRLVLIPIELSQSIPDSAWVDYEIVQNTAVHGSDYDTTTVGATGSGTLTFPAGGTTPTDSVWVQVIDDAIYEVAEFFILRLFNPVQAVLEGGVDTIEYSIRIDSDDAANVAPVGSDTSFSVNEDATLNISAAGVLGNDSDADGDPLTAVLVGGVSNGNLTLNADGSFSYTGNSNWNGTDSFTYRPNDGNQNGNLVTVSIVVNPQNDLPVAAVDTFATTEDQLLTIAATGVLLNDSDVDGDALTSILVSNVSNGTLTLNADGSFTYTGSLNWNGTDSFSYKVNDGTADGSTATVVLQVAAVDDAPVAFPDTFTVAEDASLNVAAAGVLANDTDIENDPLTAILVGGVSNGSLTLNADGSFTYVPTAGWNGTDAFSYTLSDGTLNGNLVSVLLVVSSQNDLPVSLNDSFSTQEDQTLSVPASGVLFNDNDDDGDALTAVLVADVSNGSLTLNADGSFSYVPTTDWNGTDSFTYRANDGVANGNTVTVSITVSPVNDLPVATGESYNVDEDGSLSVNVGTGVLANDVDIENSSLSAVLVSGVSNGTLVLNTDGSFDYTPDANWSGTDSFSYKVNDGTADGNTVSVTLVVATQNDGPSLQATTGSIPENATGGTEVLQVVGSDPENDALSYSIVNSDEHPFVIDAVTGVVTLAVGASLDFESVESYVVTVRVSDGTLQATESYAVSVGNVAESGTLEIILADDGDKTWIDPVELWTSSENIILTWIAEGDTLTESFNLKSGNNTIVKEICPATKDECGRDTVIVWMNNQSPQIIWLNEDSTWTNDPQHPVGGVVTYVDSTGEVQQKAFDVNDLLEEGENSPKYTFVDAYGNTSTGELTVFLDTEAPVIEILDPQPGEIFDQPVVRIRWTVDGVEQEDEVLESLTEGDVWIIRQYVDRAGNVGYDSIPVQLRLGTADAKASMERPLVSVGSDDVDDFLAELPEESRDHDFFVSLLNVAEGREEMVLSGSGSERVDASGRDVPGSTGEKHVFPTLLIEVRFPQIGGLDAAGNARGGVLEGNASVRGLDGMILKPGDAIWKLSMAGELHIFDNIGQYVERKNFSFDIADAEFVDDEGMVRAFVQVKPETSQNRVWGTGAYVVKGVVKGIATLLMNTDKHKAGYRKVTTHAVLTNFGFQREE